MIKLLRFFVLIFAVFLPDFIFLYHSGTVIQVSSKLWMFLISTPRKTRAFTVRLAVTTNTKETILQKSVAWTRPPKSRPNRSHRKRSYSISNIGNMMGCDHPSCDTLGPLVGELWRFQYFPTWRPSRILNFKNCNIWSRDCHCGPNLLLCTKFQQNWFTRSASRPP